jgi:DNA-binding protein WhiA
LVLLPAEARFVATILRRESLSAIQRQRRGRTVFVWKGEEAVLHLLRSLGGGASLSALEARGVGRQMRNSLNRVVNADTANLRRTINAGLRQATAARRLLKAGAIDEEGAVGRVAIARIGEPDASLSELAEATGLSRSSVQRALAAIEAAARVLKEETLR